MVRFAWIRALPAAALEKRELLEEIVHRQPCDVAVLGFPLTVVVMAMGARAQAVALAAVLDDIGYRRWMIGRIPVCRIVVRLDLRDREDAIAAGQAEQRRIVFPRSTRA